MSYKPSSYSGCAVSALLFVFLGIPLLALMMLGERSCDMHIGPPCTASWGWMKLLNLAVVVAICASIGGLVQLVAHIRTRDRDGSDDG
jgi:hypothetical protein